MAVDTLEILDLHATGEASVASVTLTVTSDTVAFAVATNQATVAAALPLARCTHNPLLVALADRLVSALATFGADLLLCARAVQLASTSPDAFSLGALALADEETTGTSLIGSLAHATLGTTALLLVVHGALSVARTANPTKIANTCTIDAVSVTVTRAHLGIRALDARLLLARDAEVGRIALAFGRDSGLQAQNDFEE